MYSQEIYTHVHIIILMTKYITKGDKVNNGKRCVKKLCTNLLIANEFNSTLSYYQGNKLVYMYF